MNSGNQKQQYKKHFYYELRNTIGYRATHK